jgi:hypothetical protein
LQFSRRTHQREDIPLKSPALLREVRQDLLPACSRHSTLGAKTSAAASRAFSISPAAFPWWSRETAALDLWLIMDDRMEQR